MGNTPAPGPSLGEAASNYHLPSEKARQEALRQKELATTLQNDGWVGVNQKTTALSTLKKGTSVPAAYQVDDKGETQTTNAIERDPATYEHIFSKAKKDALTIQLQYEDCSEEDLLLIQLFAIQQAIDKLLRPDQTQAEGNMHRLVKETTEAGETTMSTAEVEARKAEVCTMKSLIAHHYLQENCSGAAITMLSETAYKGGKEGHNYLEIQQGGTSYTYHANSPRDGLPTLEGLGAQQEQFLQELQEMSTAKETQTPSAQIKQLTPSNYHRLAA